MKIKTQFTVTMIIFGVMLLIISRSLVVANREIDRLDKQEEIAVGIERGVGELSYLTNNYLIYREPWQRARWEAKWSALFRDLSFLEPGSLEQRSLVSDIKGNQQRLKAVFADISAILQAQGRGDAEAVHATIEVSWSRMAVQNQAAAFDASRLSQILLTEKERLRQTTGRLIFILLSLFTAYFFINYLIVYRRTLKSISDLQAGTEVVGSGNLDFGVDVKSEDEIGQLSHAFNRMTASLKQVTASKAELEREIAERKKAEKALAAERKQLAVTLRSIGDGVITTDTEGTVVLLNRVAEELTGWSQSEAAGRPIDEVFNVVNEKTGQPAKDPIREALKTGAVTGLAKNSALIARNGAERSIADSCAPIKDKEGQVLGVVLVFRDITQTKEDEKKASARYRILSMATEAKSLDEFLRMLLDEIERVTESRIGFYHFLEDDQETLSLQEWSTNTLKKLCTAGGKGSHYPISEAGVWVEAAHKKEPVIHNDYEALTTKKGLPDGHAPVTREMVIPIIRDEKIVAIFGVGNKPTYYTQNDIETALFLSDFSWEIVERKKAEELAKGEFEISDLLLRAADVMAGELELAKILDILADIVVQFTGRSRVVINLLEQAGNRLKDAAGLGDYIIPIDTNLEGNEVLAVVKEALSQNRTILIDYAGPDVSEEERMRYQAYEPELVLYVPLALGGRVLGGLAVDEPAQRRAFTSREIRLVEGIAAQAAVAIERARLFEAEHRISATLQEAMLTMPEEISGVDLAHIYNSATAEAADVGGDFYDVFEMEYGTIGIIIGDVAGKGVEAATLTALVKNTMRAYAHQRFAPGLVMAHTNKVLVDRKTSTFVTVFFGVLNIDSGTLIYCTAGHPPPMVKRGPSVLRLENHSPVLGVIGDLNYEDYEIILRSDETLILYTDGVIEARRGEEFFGESRVEELISTLEPGDARRTADKIFKHLVDFTGGNFRDDVALLVLSLAETRKKTPPGSDALEAPVRA